MATAEIKTKLTADGSELTRALNQGISKGADFRTQMMGIGKSIGAAFTAAAVVQGIRALGQAQLESIERFKQLQQESDGFTKKIENLNEKVQNAESFKAINKALLDYKQALREVSIEIDALAAKEDAGGAAGILNFLGDVKESIATGEALSADEQRLNMLEKQREKMQRAEERAQLVAKRRAAELRKESRESLMEFDVGRDVEQSIESGNLPAMKAFLEAARETERQLRATFADSPDDGLLVQIKEAVAMSDKLAAGIEAAGRAAVQSAADLASFVATLDAGLVDAAKAAAEARREEAADMFRFLMADMMAEIEANSPKSERFSDLRRMGANELGTGIAPRQGIGPAQQAMIDLLKKQVAETGKIPEAIKTIGNLFGVFI